MAMLVLLPDVRAGLTRVCKREMRKGAPMRALPHSSASFGNSEQ